MSSTQTHRVLVDAAEIERLALNDTFASRNLGWRWDASTHESLRRVGSLKRQLDEYGFRTGELLTYEQLVSLEQEVERRISEMMLEVDPKQPHEAWVA